MGQNQQQQHFAGQEKLILQTIYRTAAGLGNPAGAAAAGCLVPKWGIPVHASVSC
jgi:hypothetical protein